MEIYAWRGARMLSKSMWNHKCFQCIWANMANVTTQYDFDRNLECVSKCNFEWICLHFKAIFRRLSGAKSREINAEMQAKTP